MRERVVDYRRLWQPEEEMSNCMRYGETYRSGSNGCYVVLAVTISLGSFLKFCFLDLILCPARWYESHGTSIDCLPLRSRQGSFP